jgi:nitrite reductase/ring-hydroxylating ferredoxin subunit
VVLDGPEGAIIVANVKGSFYAVNAKCPHLGLPMKRGTCPG